MAELNAWKLGIRRWLSRSLLRGGAGNYANFAQFSRGRICARRRASGHQGTGVTLQTLRVHGELSGHREGVVAVFAKCGLEVPFGELVGQDDIFWKWKCRGVALRAVEMVARDGGAPGPRACSRKHSNGSIFWLPFDGVPERLPPIPGDFPWK